MPRPPLTSPSLLPRRDHVHQRHQNPQGDEGARAQGHHADGGGTISRQLPAEDGAGTQQLSNTAASTVKAQVKPKPMPQTGPKWTRQPSSCWQRLQPVPKRCSSPQSGGINRPEPPGCRSGQIGVHKQVHNGHERGDNHDVSGGNARPSRESPSSKGSPRRWSKPARRWWPSPYRCRWMASVVYGQDRTEADHNAEGGGFIPQSVHEILSINAPCLLPPL